MIEALLILTGFVLAWGLATFFLNAARTERENALREAETYKTLMLAARDKYHTALAQHQRQTELALRQISQQLGRIEDYVSFPSGIRPIAPDATLLDEKETDYAHDLTSVRNS